MYSRRSLLTGLAGGGFALALPGCSALDAGPDAIPGGTHVASAEPGSIHPSPSGPVEAGAVEAFYNDVADLRATVDESTVSDTDQVPTLDTPWFDPLEELLSVVIRRRWSDGGLFSGTYSVTRGSLDADRLHEELSPSPAAAEATAGYDRYVLEDERSGGGLERGLAVGDDVEVRTHSAHASVGGDDVDVDLLSHAVQAEESDARPDGWVRDAVDAAGTSHLLHLRLQRSDDDPGRTATVSGWDVDGSEVERVGLVAAPTAEAYESVVEGSAPGDYFGDPLSDAEFESRERMAVARLRIPVEEHF